METKSEILRKCVLCESRSYNRTDGRTWRGKQSLLALWMRLETNKLLTWNRQWQALNSCTSLKKPIHLRGCKKAIYKVTMSHDSIVREGRERDCVLCVCDLTMLSTAKITQRQWKWLSMGRWYNYTGRRNPKHSEKTPPLCYCIHHKSRTDLNP
jgi:hypothetical protein